MGNLPFGEPALGRRTRVRYVCPGLALLLAGAILSACSTGNQAVNTDIGTTRVFLVAPQLGPQKFKDPNGTIQVAEWNVTVENLSLEEAPLSLDLTFGEPCLSIDTPVVSPVTAGKCGAGIVVGSFSDPRSASVELVFSMKVRRAEPIILLPADDYDGDSLPNEFDSCPLVFNYVRQRPGAPRMENTASCTVQDPSTGAVLNDADGDGVPDNFDNCVFVPNKDQRDTTGVGMGTLPDLIGDACTEQIAQVVDPNGNRAISLTLGPIDVIQPQFQLSYLTVDFNLEALACDWNDGLCVFSRGFADFCFRSDLFEANTGC